MTPLAQDLADVLALADCLPELNLSNYGQDEVSDLNQWGIEMCLAMRTHGPALAALVEDAERYQWLRHAHYSGDTAKANRAIGHCNTPEKLDAGIDAARAESAK